MSSNLQIVDAQIHVWEPESPASPWPAGGREAADRHRPQGAFTASDALDAMDEAGVARAVLVPPAWQGERNEVGVEAVRRHPDRFRVMARIQGMNPDDGARMLSECGPHRPCLGVRVLLSKPADRSAERRGDYEWLWRGLDRLGLPAMVFAPGGSEYLGELARRWAGIRFIVDHLGLTSDEVGRDLVEASAGALGLCGLSNVAAKISALPCFLPGAGVTAESEQLLRAALDSFGPRRVFWGSDLTRLPVPYRDAVDQIMLSGVVSSTELGLVMGDGLVDWLAWEELESDDREGAVD